MEHGAALHAQWHREYGIHRHCQRQYLCHGDGAYGYQKRRTALEINEKAIRNDASDSCGDSIHYSRRHNGNYVVWKKPTGSTLYLARSSELFTNGNHPVTLL